jgi:hypothetical protein
VQVAGLYLGMSRKEANITARKSGFELMQSASPIYKFVPCSDDLNCFLATPPDRFDNVDIHFGNRNQIVEIDLVEGEYRRKILSGLKGRTRRFFTEPYSDRLRLELFGPETRHELVDGGFSPVAQDTRYIYATRGITVTVSHPRTADYFLETLAFVPPTGTAR